jgi:hypothetical protein
LFRKTTESLSDEDIEEQGAITECLKNDSLRKNKKEIR